MARSVSRRDAEAFARTAKVGVTYYYIDYGRPAEIDSNGKKHQLLGEVVFQPSSRSSRFLGDDVPRWYGPLTAVDAYMKLGPLYDDRDHRDIRGKYTSREWQKGVNARAKEFLGSEHFRKELDNVASGTGFRVAKEEDVTWNNRGWRR